jgi:transposase
MPWHARGLIEERHAFVQAALERHERFAPLCRRFGISRRTGYKWLARYCAAGQSQLALMDQSPRPHTIHQIDQQVCDRVLELRKQHGWGSKRIVKALKSEGISIGHTTGNSVLKKHGWIPRHKSKMMAWIHDVMVSEDPAAILASDADTRDTPPDLISILKRGKIRDRKKAMTVIATLRGMPVLTIAKCLGIAPRTAAKYQSLYAAGSIEGLFPLRRTRINDAPHRQAVFATLHSPPSQYGINRTTWKMADLQRVLREDGHRVSESRIRRIIKAGGYRWRRARVVLTSNDPEYEEKLRRVKAILSRLRGDEAFFSIDEYGPFAVKKKPGRKLVHKADEYVVPQWQRSKGWMILTAALELSRNQVTHFYSVRKNTEEMIKMAELLRTQYRHCSKIYLSWDAASWHISKALFAYIEEKNSSAVADRFPRIELVPLPAGAQFLNVIESVFSGMARAIIHNSDYSTLAVAKDAIDRYFSERNRYFQTNPRRAGGKIWRAEVVPSEFHEGQNCKDPASR